MTDRNAETPRETFEFSEPKEVPQEGDIVAGRYRVERVLGRGGMGVVVAARHTQLRQRVAVKFLLPHALRLPGARERFLREAQAAASIPSEHVARVMDMGTLATGAPYMVMEYLSGTDLSSLLKSKGRFPISEAVDYVVQACEALAQAHRLGIVHRDLKPSNLFVTKRADGAPLLKVLDFGLSKVLESEAGAPHENSLTKTEMVVGSPHYMSPEHVRSLKHVDARTDVWALGVLLFQLLTNRRPFEGDSLPAVFARIVADPPDSLRELREEVPLSLENVVMRCLEKDLGKRIPSVLELAQMLSPFATEAGQRIVKHMSEELGDEKATVAVRSGIPPVLAAIDDKVDDRTAGGLSTKVGDGAFGRRRLALAIALLSALFAGAAVFGGLQLLLSPERSSPSQEISPIASPALRVGQEATIDLSPSVHSNHSLKMAPESPSPPNTSIFPSNSIVIPAAPASASASGFSRPAAPMPFSKTPAPPKSSATSPPTATQSPASKPGSALDKWD